jgi:hypothetical protein
VALDHNSGSSITAALEVKRATQNQQMFSLAEALEVMWKQLALINWRDETLAVKRKTDIK